MKLNSLLQAILTVCVASACTLNDGKELSDAQKQQLITAVKERLKDPDSAKFKWSAVDDPWNEANGPANEKGHFIRYCLRVNARNSFGGYVGFEYSYVTFYKKNNILIDIVVWGIGDDFSKAMCPLPLFEPPSQSRDPKHRSHDPRITDDQDRAGCSIFEGKLFCASPGTGMCWEKGHDPYKGEAPARSIDVGTDKSSPDYNHLERCS